MTKVLVVDDDPMNARMLSRLLRARGYEALTATDPEAALALAAAERPQAVVVDLLLGGGMSGTEIARRLRATPEIGTPAVIVVSGRELAEFEAEALAAGADGVETKPLDIDRLVAKIEELTNRK